MELVTSDAHQGLKNAIAVVFAGASWQRCRTHFMANLLTQVPKRAQPGVATMARVGNLAHRPASVNHRTRQGHQGPSAAFVAVHKNANLVSQFSNGRRGNCRSQSIFWGTLCAKSHGEALNLPKRSQCLFVRKRHQGPPRQAPGGRFRPVQQR